MPSGTHLKSQLNVRVSDEAHAIIAKLQEYWGLSQAAVLEKLLRDSARTEGFKLRDLLERYG